MCCPRSPHVRKKEPAKLGIEDGRTPPWRKWAKKSSTSPGGASARSRPSPEKYCSHPSRLQEAEKDFSLTKSRPGDAPRPGLYICGSWNAKADAIGQRDRGNASYEIVP